MIIPIAIGAAALSGIIWAVLKEKSTIAAQKPLPAIPPSAVLSSVTKSQLVDTSARTEDMVEVKLGDQVWAVAPDYIGPIGIGEAADLAKSLGMELPTAALVDAIWRQADLKLLPMPRNNIVSQAVFDDQKERIRQQVAGRPFTLLAGSFKDIVIQGDKFPGLYGWHVSDEEAPAFSKKFGIPLHKPVTSGPGKPIQPLSGHAHGLFFKDYSQGLRLVKRIA